MKSLEVRRAERLLGVMCTQGNCSSVRIMPIPNLPTQVLLDLATGYTADNAEFKAAIASLEEYYALEPLERILEITVVEGKLCCNVLVPLLDLNGLDGIVLLSMAKERAKSASICRHLDSLYANLTAVAMGELQPKDMHWENVLMQGILNVFIDMVSHDPWQVTKN